MCSVCIYPHSCSAVCRCWGVLPGTALQVLNNKKHGAMVIKLRGSRFAIGREIAQNIDVEVPHHGWKK